MVQRWIRSGSFLLVFMSCFTGTLRAQTLAPKTAPTRVRVFIDCEYECDTQYLRQNIDFIDYVRDRAASDMHVLVTTQETGGGGRAWTVKFIGLQYFAGQDRTLTFNTPQTASDDDRRKEFARVFRVGLAGYAAETSVGKDLDISFVKRDESAKSESKPTHDPWNNWVFSLGINGNMSGEQSSNNRSHYMNASASRTTENWKMNVSVYSNQNKSTFKIDDTNTIKSSSDGWDFNSLVVRSLGPRWSYGARSGISHSSFSNTDRSMNASPAIEFDIFPYSESTRRSITVQYSAGVTSYQYREPTIFDKLKETVPIHSLNTSVGIRAPWGSVGGSVNFSQHLNHLDRKRLSMFGNTNVRLFKGFSFNVFGNYSKISDQIGLAKGEISTEEVLLRLRQRATGYSYFMNFGINYSFGSIFNSTVNPRFGGGGGCC
jgi:hypothetical protein